jgi:DNA modification methylase
MKSIKEFGFLDPLAVWSDDNIVVEGHGRLVAAKKLGMKTVPCVRLDDLTDEQRRAYALAHNKTAELSIWDDDLLDIELGDITDIDMSQFGFDLSDIGEEDESQEIIEDEAPENVETRCKIGDLWQLGSHRLICGDSTDIAVIDRLMDGVKADMVFTDPPYNVDYSNADRPKPSKTNLGKIKNDVMGEDDFIYFLGEVYKRLDENTKTDSSFYIWYADKSTIAFYSALYETNIKFNQMIIWKKPMLLGRNRYQYAHEPCIFAVKGSPYFTEDRTKTTVWDFGGYDKSKNVHPTQKPLFLPSEALKNSSREGDAILDCFGGSGSTLIACEQLNRKCYMCELDPKYVSVILQRYINFKGSDEDVFLLKDGKEIPYSDL